jgi:Cu2+-exporting ATPase
MNAVVDLQPIAPAAADGLSSAACFHCGEPLNGSTLTARVRGRDEPVCCAGCLAVAELIASAGLDDFYRFRDTPSARPETDIEDVWTAYERPEVAERFLKRSGEISAVALLIEGLRCAACSWLIDKVLCRTPGVRRVDINAATARAYVEFDAARINLGQLLRTIAQLGYRPYPASDDALARVHQEERRAGLKRLMLSAFGMMQVMMFAVAEYAAHLGGETIAPEMSRYFRLVSMLVATPVMVYAGRPFFINAWNSLRARTIGMDVPVSTALLLAFAASTWNTFVGHGEVYFDSVTMFVFFLTLGRFVEMTVRHRATGLTEALTRHLPATAHRVRDGIIEDVPTAALACGDVILVRTGETVPADGVIVDGETALDEAVLTGESTPVRRTIDDNVAAGTLNVLAPIRVRVTALGERTLIAGIVALLQRAQAQKPAIALAADRAASKFLRYVLLAAGAVCATWLALDPTRAFPATLAVLVVACPCAFALAMPAALAAATSALARNGVLVARPDAIEALAKIDRVIFDKTGTLTRGDVQLERCLPLGTQSTEECLRIAVALESMSEHPIARAFAQVHSDASALPTVTDVRVVAGLGIEGCIDGRRYRIGRADFVAALRGTSVELHEQDATLATVVLGDETQALAQFTFSDALRDDAPQAIEALRALNIEAEILSGDVPAVVRRTAERCGIATFEARQSPEQKLARVQTLQATGATVAMIGDGINDAPVLGAANVSVAMGRGAALALAAADIVLVGEQLSALPRAIRTAQRTMRIARQNLIWSATYNFCALPLAAVGLVPPWLAAIGMSLSSVAVVLNAMRVGNAATPEKYARKSGNPRAASISRPRSATSSS